MALPLGVRNRLAELILDAFEDPVARQTLGSLSAFCEAGCEAGPAIGDGDAARLLGLGWFAPRPGGGVGLLAGYRDLGPALCSRARAGLRAVGSAAAPAPGPGLSVALDRAARLADAGLYFEVHELLEPVWLRAQGAERSALQGLIQVAVAFHHVENGNVAGAASLLEEGLRKLQAAGQSVPLPIAPWGPWTERLAALLGPLREGRLPKAAAGWPRPLASTAPRPPA